MHIVKLDPRALKDNPDRTRQSKSSAQSDTLLLATIKAVGIIQPPVVAQDRDGGNAYVIDAGHRRVKQAIAAGLEEIEVLVADASDDNGAMRGMIENIAREPLNPVDQWRGIERLVALGWTEEAIAVALALPVRQIRKLRLLANVLPAMLEQMAKGDMPSEQQLRTIAAASLEDQKEVWKAQKPKKGDTASWWAIANGLSKTRMYAKDASFGDDLAQAYGIAWVEDLFAPADEDSRYTIDVEAFLGAQQEWMTNTLPKKGAIVEVNSWGQPQLPAKADRVYGKPGKGDYTAMYLDRDGKVQTLHYRMPEIKKTKGKDDANTPDSDTADESITSKPRPDVTQKGQDMIGDFRTDALHEALGRAPIEDDMLMALLVIAFAGLNVRVDTGAGGNLYGMKRFNRHFVPLLDENGKVDIAMDRLRIAARSVLIDVLSCRRNMSNSGIVARIAGDAIGADAFLPNMGTEDFLSCLSRQALEASANEAAVLPRTKVRETRAALVEHFKDEQFVHPSALFAPPVGDLADLLKAGAAPEEDEEASFDAAEDDPSENVVSDPGPDEKGDTDEADPASAGEETGETAADPIGDDVSADDHYGIAAE